MELDIHRWRIPLALPLFTLATLATCALTTHDPASALTCSPLSLVLLGASAIAPRRLWALSSIAAGVALALALAWAHGAPAPQKWVEPPRTLRVDSGPRTTRTGWIVGARDARGAPIDLLVPRDVADYPPLPGRLVRVDARLLQSAPALDPWSPERTRPLAVAEDAPELLASPAPSALESLARAGAARRLALEHAARSSGATPEHAALALAMTTGARGLLSEDRRAPFARTGTAHVLAISGLHLGALCAILWALGTRLAGLAHASSSKHGTRRLCAPLTWSLVALYVLAIGAPVSALRALSMLTVALLGLLSLRRVPPFHTLSLAALAILCADPRHATSPGFVLSLSATGGILLATRAERGAARAAGWRVGVRISLAASLATSPAVLALSGEVPVCGLWLNLIVVPVVSLAAFPLALIGVLLSPVYPPLGAASIGLSGALMDALAALCDWGYTTPLSVWRPGVAPLWWLVIAGAGVATTLGCRARDARAAGALTLAMCAALHTFNARDHDHLTLSFLPVGQGDATLALTPSGRAILIDGGGVAARPGTSPRDPGQRVVAPHLARAGVERLELAVLTHPDADHLNGMFAAIEAAPPRALVLAAGESDPGARRLVERARALGARIVELEPGRPFTLEIDGVGVELVVPALDDATDNDRSVITTLTYGRSSALLPGDAEARAEAWWATTRARRVTLLKLGHHGSKTSSTPALLERARPIVAVTSCGWNNRHGHPHRDVVERVEELGARHFRTDRHGWIVAHLDARGHVTVRAHTLPRATGALQASSSPQENPHNHR